MHKTIPAASCYPQDDVWALSYGPQGCLQSNHIYPQPQHPQTLGEVRLHFEISALLHDVCQATASLGFGFLNCEEYGENNT